MEVISSNELFKKAQQGSEEALNILYQQNKNLIYSILKRYNYQSQDQEDLVSSGSIGLIKAIKNFNVDLNLCFSTYAVPLILGEIRKYFREKNGLKVSRGLKEKGAEVQKFIENYLSKNQEEPSIETIGNDLEVVSLANDYLDKLKKEGIEAYIDNSDKSPGFKFAEAEVNGIPVRIEIGKRDLENNMITLVRRDTREKREVFTNTDIIHDVKLLLEDIQRDMYDRALRRREEMTYTCTDIEEFKDIINNRPGFIKAMWCGNAECEAKIKEIRGCKSRCIPFNEEKVDDKCIVCGKPAKDVVIWGIQY